MSEAIVAIVDVFPDAVEIPVNAIVPNDQVFDPMGRTYNVNEVKGSPAGIVWIKAMNDPGRWCPIGRLDIDTITVIPTLDRSIP